LGSVCPPGAPLVVLGCGVFVFDFRRSSRKKKREKEMGGNGGFYKGGKGPTKRSFASSSSSMGTTKTPLEIAREEDALEAELGYHVPPADEGEEQKLGWLVNASAVRRRRRLFLRARTLASSSRERETRDWKNSKIISISPRARDVVSLSLSPRSPRPSKTTFADETRAFSLSPSL
tara:strand:+ start:278 stop:805 length:528 start_codon:yes stop_codon:yes gene_type:complete